MAGAMAPARRRVRFTVREQQAATMRHLGDIVSNQRPVKLPKTARVSEAWQRMTSTRIGSVLVVDEDDALCGIFTGSDLIDRVIQRHKDAETTSLADVMTEKPICMTPDESAIEALRLMWDGGIHHLPIVKDERILGVVAPRDFASDENARLSDERELWEHMR